MRDERERENEEEEYTKKRERHKREKHTLPGNESRVKVVGAAFANSNT